MTTHEIKTADVVAFAEHEGDLHVLLVLRRWDPFAGCWALPGGHLDLGEADADAAARELAEETGVQVASDDLFYIGRWDAPGRDPRGRYATSVYVVELAELVPLHPADDATDARWIRVSEPLRDQVRLAFDHHEIVEAAVTALWTLRDVR